MVTVRQVGRGVIRTMRAIDREAKRAERQRTAYEKAAQKQALLEASADAAQQFAALVEALTGTHRVNLKRKDWFSVAAREQETPPESETSAHDAAVATLATYKPSWFAKTLGLEKGARRKLEAKIVDAEKLDQQSLAAKRAQIEASNSEVRFAKRLVAGDQEAIEQALTEHSAIGSLPYCVEGIDLIFDEGRLIVLVDGLDLEDMPTQSITLLQSGKASIKAISRPKIIEMHRDNICASALRVALECLQALPIQEIEIVMHTDLLNRGTGHIASDPVLYIRVNAQAISSLNLDRTDAEAVVDRLGGHYTWSKRDGYSSINLGAFGIQVRDVEDGQEAAEH